MGIFQAEKMARTTLIMTLMWDTGTRAAAKIQKVTLMHVMSRLTHVDSDMRKFT